MSTVHKPQMGVARAADARPLSALAERTFRDTFAGDNSTQDMDAYMRSACPLSRVRGELADTANVFLLTYVENAAQPAGYAKRRAGSVDPDVAGPEPIELQRIYVDRSVIGRGAGAALMHASLEAARTVGHQTLWLGVWEHNARAISFYERWQFKVVGDHVFRLG